MKRFQLVTIAFAASCGFATAHSEPATFEYSGMCDASGAVALDDGLFVVASDEDNVLRVYRRGEPDAKQLVPLDTFLKPDPDEPEADLEGASRIGSDIYWITSHGQNKNGKLRSSRHRLFVTRFAIENGKISIVPIGTPYVNLRSDLIAAPQLAKFDLASAAKLPPEEKGGFNIEGLAATPDGRLLLGFRNPITNGSALVVTIDNPTEIQSGQKAKIGEAFELSLSGHGIRSIEYSERRGDYLLVAGPHDDAGSFALFTWSGRQNEEAMLVPGVDFGTLNPEALFFDPADKTSVQVLSDDGGRKIGGKDCKKIDPQLSDLEAFP